MVDDRRGGMSMGHVLFDGVFPFGQRYDGFYVLKIPFLPYCYQLDSFALRLSAKHYVVQKLLELSANL